jgi:large subunit ribosomal protein L13Ae
LQQRLKRKKGSKNTAKEIYKNQRERKIKSTAMFEKQIVVDGKDHILGRLASYVAKELINGQRIVVVRAERIILSGSLFRRRVQFTEFLHKRMLHNPRRALQHYKSPSRIFWKAVRGMLPHKTPRGAAALGRYFIERRIFFLLKSSKRINI